MIQFRIECSEVNYFTVLVEAETEEQAKKLAHANINSFDVEDEHTSEWVIAVSYTHLTLPTTPYV